MANQTLPMVTASQTKFSVTNEASGNTETTIEIVQVRVTVAQLLALKTTNIAIIPAALVNAGEAIWLESAMLKYNFGTTAYTLNAGTLKLFYGPVANALALTADLSASFLTAAASRAIVNVPFLKIGPDTITNTTAQGIFLGNDGTANFTLGDATLDVTLTYGRTTP